MDAEAKDILVVVSKLKKYVRAKAGMNTSGNTPPRLTEIIQQLVDVAIENARKDGRKTVMDRDFEFFRLPDAGEPSPPAF
jgi:histone H3/H4